MVRAYYSSYWGVVGIFTLMLYCIYAPPISANDNLTILTLSDSIQLAFDNNPLIRSGQESIKSAHYSLLKTRTDLFPKLHTYYEFVYESERDYLWPDFPVSTNNNYSWEISIDQDLFTGFKLTNTIKKANLSLDLRKISLEIDKLNLALKVKQAYYKILKVDKNAALAQQVLNLINAHLSIAHRFYDVGKIPAHDLLEAEVRHANAQENLIHAQNSLNLAHAEFNMVVSRPLDMPIHIKDILVHEPVPEINASQLTKAIHRRLNLKALDIKLKQVDLEAKISQSGYYPNISVHYEYLKKGDDPTVSGSDFHHADYWEVSALVGWCFWDWGKNRYKILEKKSHKKQIFHSRTLLLNQIRLEINEALLDLKHAEETIKTMGKAVTLAEENLRTKQSLFQLQMTTSTEVLDAQSLLSQAQTQLYNAIYDHNIAKARLMRALGSIEKRSGIFMQFSFFFNLLTQIFN